MYKYYKIQMILITKQQIQDEKIKIENMHTKQSLSIRINKSFINVRANAD